VLVLAPQDEPTRHIKIMTQDVSLVQRALMYCLYINLINQKKKRDQRINYKTLKVDIHSFPACRLAIKEVENQAVSLLVVSLGKFTKQMP